MIGNILGRDPNCYTGGDCWNYDHSTRSILILSIIIAISELVLSNSTILMLVDRKVFLTIFRIKNIITLLMVPRLWLGDQS